MEAILVSINSLVANYATFFSWEAIHAVITDPVSWGIIFWLVVLEGLLSCDNALVLAVLVKKLPHNQQKKAFFYGIWGAYLFRFIAIGLGTFLIKMQWVQILGAGYLLWMSAKFFFSKDNNSVEEDNSDVKVSGFLIRLIGSFWATVVAVELMDITFSVDSILAAFAMSDQVWVLFIGGVLGILMMRGVASVFIKLLEKFPTLEDAAYVLIALIGCKLLAQSFGYHVSNVLFFGVMASVLIGTIALHYVRESGKKTA